MFYHFWHRSTLQVPTFHSALHRIVLTPCLVLSTRGHSRGVPEAQLQGQKALVVMPPGTQNLSVALQGFLGSRSSPPQDPGVRLG